MVEYKYNAWGKFKILDADGNEITDETHIGYLNPFRYRGYYYSDDLGLYYLKSRFYDPEVGRFISADTVDYLAPDTVNGLNLYAYCNNNPVMYCDPEGHFGFLTILAIVAYSALFGAISGAATSAVAYSLEHHDEEFVARDFIASVVGGAVSGAITGAFSGAVIIAGGAGAMIGFSALAGAVANAAGSLAEGLINGKFQESPLQYFCSEILPSTISGAAFGALLGVMQSAEKPAKSLIQALNKLKKGWLGEIGGNLLSDVFTLSTTLSFKGILHSWQTAAAR